MSFQDKSSFIGLPLAMKTFARSRIKKKAILAYQKFVLAMNNK